MSPCRWVLLLLLLAPQDEIEDALRDLASDDVAARSDAEAKLAALSEKALPKIQAALTTADGELKTRLRRLCTTITRDVRRATALGKAVAVSLKAERMPFREAVAELEKRSGFGLWVDPAVENRPVSLTLQETPWLDAVALLCRSHGDAATLEYSYPEENRVFHGWRVGGRERAGFAIVQRPATNEPSMTTGPFRISIHGLDLDRSRDHDSSVERLTVHLRAVAQPNARPLGVAFVEWEHIRDDTGLECMTEADANVFRRPRASLVPYRSESTRFTGWCSKLPKVEAKTLAVKGSIGWWFGVDVPAVTIAPGSIGVKTQIGDFFVTLDSVTTVKDGVQVKLTETLADSYPWKDAHGGPNELVVLRYLDQEGKELATRGSGGSYERGKMVRTQGLALAAGQRLASIELRSWTEFWIVEVPFEFKEVKLPQW